MACAVLEAYPYDERPIGRTWNGERDELRGIAAQDGPQNTTQ
jgi:hypothetical protein